MIPYDYKPSTLWYRFKCWAWNRYSTVKSRHLPHTWVDRDQLLPYTMFEILCDFMEKENPGEIVEWEDNPDLSHAWKEMNRLYKWWNEVYIPFANRNWEHDTPQIISHKEGDYYRLEFKYRDEEHRQKEMNLRIERDRLERQMEKELIENMKALCEIHQYMWT